MNRPFSKVLDQLQNAGLRPTRQRMALARLLFDGADRHVTAEQLHAEACAAGCAVSLATVYNTLHQFTHAGILREVVVEPSRSYFDTNTSEHHHFFYDDRGELFDIPAESLSLGELPTPPNGDSVARVDVIIRLKRRNRKA